MLLKIIWCGLCMLNMQETCRITQQQSRDSLYNTSTTTLHFIYKRWTQKTLVQKQDRGWDRLILSFTYQLLLAFKANIFRALSKLPCMFRDDLGGKNLSSTFQSEGWLQSLQSPWFDNFNNSCHVGRLKKNK